MPELAKIRSFTGVALLSGAIWAAFHFPFVFIFGAERAGYTDPLPAPGHDNPGHCYRHGRGLDPTEVWKPLDGRNLPFRSKCIWPGSVY